jgi:hypothetical protein
MELKAKLGGNAELKTFAEDLEDRACEELKARYIAQGIIKPSETKYGPRERPFMSPEMHRELRKRWIEQGLLQPRGTINHAFQKRGAAPQDPGARETGQSETGDFGSVGEGNPQGETPRARGKIAYAHETRRIIH